MIVFPDVEMWAANYLRPLLEPGDYVGLHIPNPRRDRMVTVRRDGGPRLDTVREAARLGVNCWATTEQDAYDLAATCRALLGIAAGNGPILRVQELSGPSAIPDEQPRRFFTVELIVRGSDL